MVNSVDVLTENGWKNVSALSIKGHCAILFNSTTIFIIGGMVVENVVANETIFFNTETDNQIWTPGIFFTKQLCTVLMS